MILLFLHVYSITLVFRAFQGLCINEFSGLQFDRQNSFDIQTGEQVSKDCNPALFWYRKKKENSQIIFSRAIDDLMVR